MRMLHTLDAKETLYRPELVVAVLLVHDLILAVTSVGGSIYHHTDVVGTIHDWKGCLVNATKAPRINSLTDDKWLQLVARRGACQHECAIKRFTVCSLMRVWDGVHILVNMIDHGSVGHCVCNVRNHLTPTDFIRLGSGISIKGTACQFNELQTYC